MNNASHEPHSPAPTPRPCSTPHSAPVEWLRAGADSPEPGDPDSATHDETALAAREAAISLILSSPDAIGELIERAAPDDARDDGWTPFARRLFLSVLAETGRVSIACEYTRLSRQSAYALRARDRLFAAGWDAACELARAPLADALYEKALDGVTDIITKDGEVVATRHRLDSRLSLGVLSRLDKRCDRAEERGSGHLAIVARWDEWIAHVGHGDDQAALALLEAEPPTSANQCQPCQLPLNNPAEVEDDGLDLSDRCWWDEVSDCWLTDFPPPAGFSGYENRRYDEREDEETYVRACTKEEVAILEADVARARGAERAEQEALRDAWFALLKAESEAA